MPVNITSGNPPTLSVAFGELETVALFNLGKKKVIYDQFIKATPLLDILNKKARVSDTGGGKLIERFVRYGDGAPVYAFQGDQAIPVSKQDNKLPLFMRFRNLATGVKVIDEEEIEAKEADPIIVMLAEATEWAVRGMSNYVNKILFEDGSDQGGLVPVGIDYWISTDPTTGIVGGIDRAAYPWFRNNYSNAGGTWSDYGIFGAVEDKMLAMYNQMTYGDNAPPDLLLSDPTMIEYYERQLPDYIHIMGADGDVNTGFGTLTYKKIPWVVDRNCPSGRVYFLNTSSMEFLVSSKWNMQPTPFYSLAVLSVMGKVSFLILRSQFIVTQPFKNGVVFGYTGY